MFKQMVGCSRLEASPLSWKLVGVLAILQILGIPGGDMKSSDLPASLLGLQPTLKDATLNAGNAVFGSGHGGMLRL